MPIQYWILRDANITYARWHDDIDIPEIRRNFEAYLKDPHYKAGRPELIDLRDVTQSAVDIGGISMLLNKANSQDFGAGGGTLTSILVTDEAGMVIRDNYQSLADMRDGIQVHISDLGGCRSWCYWPNRNRPPGLFECTSRLHRLIFADSRKHYGAICAPTPLYAPYPNAL